MKIKPQDRKPLGQMIFKKNGASSSADKIWSIPAKDCEGCPLYKVDVTTQPNSYYCQVDFYSHLNVKSFVQDKKVPESCQIPSIKGFRL